MATFRIRSWTEKELAEKVDYINNSETAIDSVKDGIQAGEIISETDATTGITDGVIAKKVISAAKFKALLGDGEGTSSTEVNLFELSEGDIVTDLSIVFTKSTTECNLTVGVDAGAQGTTKDADGIFTTLALDSSDAKIDFTGLYAATDDTDSDVTYASNAGAEIVNGLFTAKGDGYITLSTSADIAGDGTFVGQAVLTYIPA